jgi:periplasmic divalent cation tolerance protein
MKIILVYITNPTKKEAEKVANFLLDKKLIACANIFPIKSFYWWKGKKEKGNEFVLIGKTLENNFEKIKKETEKVHSYKTPCILNIPATANEKYYKWMKSVLS